MKLSTHVEDQGQKINLHKNKAQTVEILGSLMVGSNSNDA